ncbi:MAG: M24 family metallopeptidase [Parvibaculaceae bacterium]
MSDTPYIERAFPEAEYRGRLDRVRAQLRKAGLDALIIHAPEDINYLSGFNSCGYYSYQHLMIGADPSADCFFTRIVEIGIVRATSIIPETIYWTDWDDHIAMAADSVTAKGLGKARIGIQETSLYLSVKDWRRFGTLLPGVTFVDVSDLLPRLRLVKSPLEVDCMRRAGEITDAGLAAGLAAIAEGRREGELAAAAYQAMFAAGGEPPSYPGTFTSGPRTCFLHGMATERRLQRGDLIVMEPMGCYQRYNTNAIRTAVIGAPSAKAQEAHRLMEDSVLACTELVRPGILAEDVDRLCRKITGKFAANRLHRSGYSLEIGYAPGFIGALNLRQGDTTPLAAGMVISIEPNTTFADEGWGVQLGNCVLVTETGHEVLHHTPIALARF